MNQRPDVTPDVASEMELLRLLRRLAAEADELIAACVRDRLSLRAILGRFLPALERWLGARGAVVTTRNEHLVEESYSWGAWAVLGGADLHEEEGRAVVVGGGTALWTRLRVAGQEVGRIAVLFDGERAGEEDRLHQMLAEVCAGLDVVLATIHIAGDKQRLIVDVEELLTDPVFDRGVDRAVAALHQVIRVPDFVLLYRDDVDGGRLRYRVYRDGEPRHASEGALPRHITLEAAIEERGDTLLRPETKLLKLVTGVPQGVETLLSTGMMQSQWLGKVVCSAPATTGGFSAFALDVVQVMCEAMSQRLVDFNRERRHLAQFFCPRVIGELLADADYQRKWLAPREETIAILFADINAFTKISEQVLEKPAAIGEFVDRWSAGAVERLWRVGGAFDKMVGDCVIGLFGPPFYRDPPEARARAALEAAREISRFTAELEREPPWNRIPASGVVPGLGVAIGLNLCSTAVGIFGPNQDFTGFSAGMNATARLQSLAGFRETLAMEPFCQALAAGGGAGYELGEICESMVKNVKHPLCYRRVVFTTAGS
jgi:adenylate cyclase